MEPVMRRFMEKHGIDAGALGAIWNGTIVYNKPFGWMDKSRTIGIRNDVMMRVASLTKLVTAAAVRKLEEGGRITLNDRVFDVGQPGGGILELQPWPSIGDPCIADITVNHLLRHRGGFVSNKDVDRDYTFQAIEIAKRLNISSPPGREMMIRYALGQKLECVPGQQYKYSNIGYMALGLVIEKSSGMRYLDYIREYVSAPLCISTHDVIQGRTQRDDRNEREPWYDSNELVSARNVFDPDGPRVCWPDGGWHLEAFLSHCGLVMTMEAMLKFADGHFIRYDTSNIGRRWTRSMTIERTTPKCDPPFGSLDGTSTVAVQPSSDLTYVVMFNRRPPHGAGWNAYWRELCPTIESLLVGLKRRPTPAKRRVGQRVQPKKRARRARKARSGSS